MSSNPARLDYLFKKYITNSCSHQELGEFWLLLSQLSNEEQLAIGLHEVWQQQPNTKSAQNKEHWENAYNRLHTKIMLQQSHTVKKTTKLIAWQRNYVRITAAAVLVGLCVWAGYLFFSSPVIMPAGTASQPVSASENMVAQTPVKVITLADGTVVTLRENSRLQYDAASWKNSREVTLTGEAYFDVKHDGRRPFIVHAGGYAVYVLGTAFNVKEIAGRFEVAVARGKVKVQEDQTNRALGVLLPGRQLVVNSVTREEGSRAIETLTNASEIAGWMRQTLVFNNVTWLTASQQVSRHYGVQVKFKTAALQQCRFTGDFTNKTLDDCLDIICMLTKAKWYKEGVDVIWIDGEGCP